jgi:DNA-binding transcriptional LysR family regulator
MSASFWRLGGTVVCLLRRERCRSIMRRSHAGSTLVERCPEGYVLTPAGTRALAAASDMETAVRTLGRGGTDGSPKGLVPVNAPPALAQGFLISRLIDSRMVEFDEVVRLSVKGPMVAVGREADPPPWHALSFAPLCVVADAYRAAGAEVFNVPDAAAKMKMGEMP